jgi:hypothetical protein
MCNDGLRVRRLPLEAAYMRGSRHTASAPGFELAHSCDGWRPPKCDGVLRVPEESVACLSAIDAAKD